MEESGSVIENETQKYKAPALAKGLQILELLAAAKAPMPMVEIGKALGRSKSEIYRMLVELEQRGYVARAASSDLFSITDKLFELAMISPPRQNLVAIALPHMQRLAEDIDQSCHLAVLSGHHIVVVSRVEAPGELGFAVRLGYRRRIDQSTSGTVLMAFSEASTRQHLLNALINASSEFDADKYEALLRRIERKGFHIEDSAVVKGITDIGAPIFDYSGHACAALTVPYIERERGPVTQKAVAETVLEIAQAISKKLAVGSPFQA